jgi:uncharacterized protein YaiL (DUF2058 family)
MTDSLRDQLLKLGFPEPPKEVPKAASSAARQNRPQSDRPASARPGSAQCRPDRPNPQRPHGPGRDARHQAPPQGRSPTGSAGGPPQPHVHKSHTGKSQAEIDLGKAYALRAQKEKDERIEAERQKQEAARVKREAKAKVAELLKDNTLNDVAAELVRHFDYNGKIKRIHVNADQLKALNAGNLGVVQLDGRYLLVTAENARQAQALLPSLLALLVDPNAPTTDDPYADPEYQVPDDLVW